MSRTSENKRIEAKKQEWDEALAEFNSSLRKAYKELLKDLRIMINWMFFYQPKNKDDRWWHLLEVACVIIILLNIFE